MRNALSLVTVVTLAGCVQLPLTHKSGQGDSGLSSVNVKLPARDAFGADAKTALLDTVYLHIEPVRSDCVSATSVSQMVDYDKASIEAHVYSGCDYRVMLALGKRLLAAGDGPITAAPVEAPTTTTDNGVEDIPPPPTTLSLAPAEAASTATSDARDKQVLAVMGKKVEAIYTNFRAALIKGENLAKVEKGASYPFTVNLQLTKYGAANGFPQAIAESIAPVSEADSVSEETGALPLASYELTNAAGDKLALKSLAKGRYLMLKYGQPLCLGCIEDAVTISQDAALMQAVSAGKCSLAILVSENTLGAWLETAALPDAAKQISYAAKGNIQDKTLLDLDSMSVNFVPDVRIYDLQAGKLLGKNKAEFIERCKAL